MVTEHLKITTLEEVSSILGISTKTLVALAGSMNDQVKVENKPKSHGEGYREICKPSWLLKRTLNSINRKILQTIPLPENLQGGVPHKSTKLNAQHHTGKPTLLTLDIKNFYPGIHYTRVYDLFIKHGYSPDVANWFTRVTTYNNHLAQGFPTSSTIANLILSEITPRINNLCKRHQITFTTFQDNLYFSGSSTVPKFANLISRILRQEGFATHGKKVMLRNKRQVVSGWVVNKKVNVSDKEYRTLRTTIHRCKVLGLNAVADRSLESYKLHLLGRIQRVIEVNPAKGEKLLNDFNGLE